jgi:hypothetical protein
LIPVIATPTVHDTAVTAPIISSPIVTINENEEPVVQDLVQDPIEPVAAHEEEYNNPR